MEEASIAAVNGELSPFTSGVTACRMIGACRDLTDYRRASEWIEATEKYCDRQSLEGFPGHLPDPSGRGRGGRRRLGARRAASWNGRRPSSRAYNADAAAGRRLLRDRRHPPAAAATSTGAEAALREAHARGRSPQPALALVRLAQGNVKAAAKAIDAAVAERDLGSLGPGPAAAGPGRDRHRGRRRGPGPDGGRRARRRSSRATRRRRSRPAAGSRSAGCSWPRATPPAAARELRTAIKGWREVGAPYEVARARAVLSRALAGGRRRGRRRPGAARRRSTSSAGSARGSTSRRPSASSRDVDGSPERAADRPRKTFMFTDIVGSTSLAEALGDEAWERLLRWHDDMLRELVAAGAGRSSTRPATASSPRSTSARPAVDAAIAIQRALRDHRASTGFALPVRIGLHAAEATRRGDDYSGMGVHVAARIGALAEGRRDPRVGRHARRGRRRPDEGHGRAAGPRRRRRRSTWRRSPGP